MTRLARPILAATALVVAGAMPLAAESPPVRTLEDVTIEGEVRLPQILFISSRDTERPLDVLRQLSSDDAIVLGRSTPLPWRIVAPTSFLSTHPVTGAEAAIEATGHPVSAPSRGEDPTNESIDMPPTDTQEESR